MKQINSTLYYLHNSVRYTGEIYTPLVEYRYDEFDSLECFNIRWRLEEQALGEAIYEEVYSR